MIKIVFNYFVSNFYRSWSEFEQRAVSFGIAIFMKDIYLRNKLLYRDTKKRNPLT